jgi:glucose/arabinose dehydrogenase
MRVRAISATFVVFASLQFAAAPLLLRPALGCPPSNTWTTGPDTEAGFVLAEGALAAVRTAGPFEVPWSVAPLPDGSFLVTERPGRLQHVRPGIDTHQVSGTPPVLYIGHGGLLDVALDPGFADNGIVYLSFLQGGIRPQPSRCSAPGSTPRPRDFSISR